MQVFEEYPAKYGVPRTELTDRNSNGALIYLEAGDQLQQSITCNPIIYSYYLIIPAKCVRNDYRSIRKLSPLCSPMLTCFG